MKRIFIKKSEIMQITGWKRTKAGKMCTLIRDAYSYPPFRNDILVKDFCTYMELKEEDIQEALAAEKPYLLPKGVEMTAQSVNNARDLQRNSS